MMDLKKWLKAHRTIATLIAIIVTLFLMGILFLLWGWIFLVLVKKEFYWHLVFNGFWNAIITIIAIRVNSRFQKWLLIP
jgi:hypothetical protein